MNESIFGLLSKIAKSLKIRTVWIWTRVAITITITIRVRVRFGVRVRVRVRITITITIGYGNRHGCRRQRRAGSALCRQCFPGPHWLHFILAPC